MKTVLLSAAFCVLPIVCGYAADKLVAYPVPFDPAHQTMRLMYQPSRGAGSVRVEIFDVNGDSVMSREYSSITDFVWKGYNRAGRRVGNGMYIVKTRWENNSTGEVHTDTVRITVVERSK